MFKSNYKLFAISLIIHAFYLFKYFFNQMDVPDYENTVNTASFYLFYSVGKII